MSIYQLKGTLEDVANAYLRGRDPTTPFAEMVSTHPWFEAIDDDGPQFMPFPSMIRRPERTVPKLVYDPAKLEFLETVHESASNAVFKVKWEGELRTLKVNHLLLPDMQRDVDLRQGNISEGGPLADRFSNELKAYNRLLHCGLCEAGLVPRPYGWFVFMGFDDPCWQPPQNGSGRHFFPTSPYETWLKNFKDEMRWPRALLLEWIDAPRLVTPRMTSDQFRCLFVAWESIHKARIIHNDLSPRNTFARGSKVVIVDFDRAEVLPSDSDIETVSTTVDIDRAIWCFFDKAQYRNQIESDKALHEYPGC